MLPFPPSRADMPYRGPFDASMPDARRLRVLVIDESPSGREAISRSLSRDDDLEVIVVTSATQAFDVIAVTRPDVIVLDIDLTGMGSIGFLDRIMSIDPIPVILACDIVHPSAVAAL